MFHIPQNLGRYSLNPSISQLFNASFGADRRVGNQEDFERCIGANDGADVTAVENRAHGFTGWVRRRRVFGEIALKFQQRGADSRNGGNRRGGFSGGFIAQVSVIEQIEAELLRRLGRGFGIMRVAAAFQHGQADGAVNRAGIQIGQPKMAMATKGVPPMA